MGLTLFESLLQVRYDLVGLADAVVGSGVVRLGSIWQPCNELACRHAQEIHFVVPNQARACSQAELEALVPADFRARGGRVVRATVEGLFPSAGRCTAGGADDVVVVTGSIYLLGEVMAQIGPGVGAGEGRLQDF